MNVVYVNKKSETSMLKHAFETAGFRCFRVRTECDCQDQGNRRDGVIVLDGDKALIAIRRRKDCFRRINPNLCAGGAGQ